MAMEDGLIGIYNLKSRAKKGNEFQLKGALIV